MTKIQGKRLNDYIRSVKRTGKVSDDIICKGVYKGARVIADAIKDEIKDIPIDNGYGSPEEPVNGISNRQKADSIEGMGTAPIQEDSDFISAKVGWDGYGRDKTREYPKGIPDQAIARSVNSGTSFRKKNPSVNRAITKNKKTAVKAVADIIENEIKREMR